MKKVKITKKNKAELQVEFINFLVHDLFNGVSTDDVLKVTGPNIISRGKILSSGDKMELINGAKAIRSLVVWRVLLDEMKEIAGKRIYESSKTIEDITFAKAMLYALDVLEKKVEHLSNLR